MDSKVRCMEYAKIDQLPPEWDGGNFIKAIALVKRISGREEYVIIKQVGEAHMVVKDFGDSGVASILKIYPYEVRVKGEAEKNFNTDELKTKVDCIAWLSAAGVDITQHKSKTFLELKKLIKTIQ